jgi:hypothetical protein
MRCHMYGKTPKNKNEDITEDILIVMGQIKRKGGPMYKLGQIANASCWSKK